MDGIYYKEWSAVLDRAMEFKRYGHSGVPVLALPARGGRFYDWENNGMPEAVASLLHAGKVQLFCADSIDGESLLAGNSAPRRRAEMQEKYFLYLTTELAPRVLALTADEPKAEADEKAAKAASTPVLWCAGVDTGAYQAVNCRLRRPELFAGAIGLSGLYDMSRFMGSEADDLILRNSPLNALAETGIYNTAALAKAGENSLLLCAGQGAYEDDARAASKASNVGIAVDGTYVELSYADEEKRKAEVTKVLSQIPVAKALGAGCMGSETTNMAKQPGISRKEAQEALLRSLGEILPACEEQGVLFAVECVYYHAMNTPEAVKMVLDTMASPNLRVICDFANYVGPENASVDAQRRLWDKVGSWYGDKIVAVHFKGQNFQPNGTLYSTSLEDSCVDYAGGFEMLRQMPQASLPVLREEAVPARAASDIAFMKQFVS